jgi:hypothetical protein
MATLALRGRLPFLFSSRNTIIAFVALLHFSSLSIAGEIEELSVTEKDGEYRLRIIEVFDVPADYVYNVITDYTHAYRINPAITEVEILSSSDDAVIRVRNHSEHWVGPFYFKIDVGDLLMKKYLQEDTLATFNRIECNAMIMLERDMENDTKYLKTWLTSGKDCSNASG